MQTTTTSELLTNNNDSADMSYAVFHNISFKDEQLIQPKPLEFNTCHTILSISNTEIVTKGESNSSIKNLAIRKLYFKYEEDTLAVNCDALFLDIDITNIPESTVVIEGEDKVNTAKGILHYCVSVTVSFLPVFEIQAIVKTCSLELPSGEITNVEPIGYDPVLITYKSKEMP